MSEDSLLWSFVLYIHTWEVGGRSSSSILHFRVTTQIIPSPQLDVPTHPKETKTNRQHYMRLQYTYATSTYMYTHICIHMSICTQPCRQKGSSAPTWSHSRVEKKTVNNKKHPETLGPRESRCVCWTMDNGYDDIDLQLIGYMYTYLMYTYIRSGQVK